MMTLRSVSRNNITNFELLFQHKKCKCNRYSITKVRMYILVPESSALVVRHSPRIVARYGVSHLSSHSCDGTTVVTTAHSVISHKARFCFIGWQRFLHMFLKSIQLDDKVYFDD